MNAHLMASQTARVRDSYQQLAKIEMVVRLRVFTGRWVLGTIPAKFCGETRGSRRVA